MASHDDLVLIIKQLLQGLDKMGDSLEVVKAIKQDVEDIKRRVDKMEERISHVLPTKSEVFATREMLDEKLKPLDQIRVMDERIMKIEASISQLREMKETSASISDSPSIKDVYDLMVKSFTQNESSGSRDKALEEPNQSIGVKTSMPLISFDPMIKGERVYLTNKARIAERIRPSDGTGFAGVISREPIREDEVFNVRIQGTCGFCRIAGIAFGVIRDRNPVVAEVSSIYKFLEGTWAINSSTTAVAGKSHTWKDCNIEHSNGYSLDTRRLSVGTVLGIKLCGNGDLRFYLDGVDKGVAFRNVPRDVYAFVDIINYVTKISTC